MNKCRNAKYVGTCCMSGYVPTSDNTCRLVPDACGVRAARGAGAARA